MSKYIKLIIFCTLSIFIFNLSGCAVKSKINIKVIYLIPKSGGQLSKEELEKQPEIFVSNSFSELKKLVSKDTAIWIDKDAIGLVDEAWLQKEPQNKVPLVLIGYNDALYSFREKLTGFGIKGPYVD